MLRHQESRLGVTIAWLLAPAIFTLVGFYLGTIWASPSTIDLQYHDIQDSIIPALIGLALGTLLAVLVTLFYPRVIDRDYRDMEAHAHDEHH
jgi:hypothetical protein